jgi:hypothetical protein
VGRGAPERHRQEDRSQATNTWRRQGLPAEGAAAAAAAGGTMVRTSNPPPGYCSVRDRPISSRNFEMCSAAARPAACSRSAVELPRGGSGSDALSPNGPSGRAARWRSPASNVLGPGSCHPAGRRRWSAGWCPCPERLPPAQRLLAPLPAPRGTSPPALSPTRPRDASPPPRAQPAANKSRPIVRSRSVARSS